jgi:succinate dehydrogenase hydrophobic anchor subunit
MYFAMQSATVGGRPTVRFPALPKRDHKGESVGTPSLGSGGSGPGAQVADLLAATEGLRARTRAQMNGSWVSLLGFGLLALASAPVARYAFNFGAHGRNVASYPAFAYAELIGLCVVHEPGTPCLEGEFDGAVLRFVAWGVWFGLLPLAWFAFARWYHLRGEVRGVVPRRGMWICTTAVVTAVIMTALTSMLFGLFGWSQSLEVALLQNNYASPWYLVGIGLVALGLVERSWIAVAAGAAHALLLTGYLGASWGTGWLPWQHPAHPDWTDGPQVKALLLASILLLAGLGEWGVARHRAGPARADADTVVP